MFYALEPSSQYEVVIQSQNRWGWSENSDPFFFSTRANGKYHHICFVPLLQTICTVHTAKPINRGHLIIIGELIYAWKKVRLKSRLGSNLTFSPGSVNPDFFPRFKPENLLLNTARFPCSNLGYNLTSYVCIDRFKPG